MKDPLDWSPRGDTTRYSPPRRGMEGGHAAFHYSTSSNRSEASSRGRSPPSPGSPKPTRDEPPSRDREPAHAPPQRDWDRDDWGRGGGGSTGQQDVESTGNAPDTLRMKSEWKRVQEDNSVLKVENQRLLQHNNLLIDRLEGRVFLTEREKQEQEQASPRATSRTVEAELRAELRKLNEQRAHAEQKATAEEATNERLQRYNEALEQQIEALQRQLAQLQDEDQHRKAAKSASDAKSSKDADDKIQQLRQLQNDHRALQQQMQDLDRQNKRLLEKWQQANQRNEELCQALRQQGGPKGGSHRTPSGPEMDEDERNRMLQERNAELSATVRDMRRAMEDREAQLREQQEQEDKQARYVDGLERRLEQMQKDMQGLEPRKEGPDDNTRDQLRKMRERMDKLQQLNDHLAREKDRLEKENAAVRQKWHQANARNEVLSESLRSEMKPRTASPVQPSPRNMSDDARHYQQRAEELSRHVQRLKEALEDERNSNRRRQEEDGPRMRALEAQNARLQQELERMLERDAYHNQRADNEDQRQHDQQARMEDQLRKLAADNAQLRREQERLEAANAQLRDKLQRANARNEVLVEAVRQKPPTSPGRDRSPLGTPREGYDEAGSGQHQRRADALQERNDDLARDLHELRQLLAEEKEAARKNATEEDESRRQLEHAIHQLERENQQLQAQVQKLQHQAQLQQHGGQNDLANETRRGDRLQQTNDALEKELEQLKQQHRYLRLKLSNTFKCNEQLCLALSKYDPQCAAEYERYRSRREEYA